MTNKVIIGILVLLVILMGGIGYYSYTLNQQVNYLGKQLTNFQTKQTARINAVSNELTALRQETLSSIDNLEGKLGETTSEIDSLKGTVGESVTKIGNLEDEIDMGLSRIDSLEDQLTSATSELARTVIDAEKVYQKVSQATVRISDGQAVIGSGFIFDNKSHVVTAHHVIENLSQIYVILSDGRVSKASTIGHCEYSDIAVLKLAVKPAIEPLPLADSSEVRIGEAVVAIGNPFNLRETLTSGIISQINRYSEIQYDMETRWIPNLIQFDAAVNSGNSGCPLANSNGEVIGLVVARINPYEGDGIYYAVSSNKVKRVANTLIKKGYFDYPWLGIGITALTPQMVQDRSLETANGVLVGQIFDSSPAQAAGIQVDDIILAIDGMAVRDAAELTSYLGEYKSPGDDAIIELKRGTDKLELPLEIGNRES